MPIPARVGERDASFAAPVRDPWRLALPTLEARTAVIREVTVRDAASLQQALTRPEVQRHLPVGPTTVDAYVRFIRWVRRERRAGRYVCFSVIPRATGRAAGIFQLWPVEPGFGTAEMGFALDPALWGTGAFVDCATAVLDFGFSTLGIRRLECRSAVTNARGIAALLKLGAVHEGTLRQCFPCPDGVVDHSIWSILVDEWKQRRSELVALPLHAKR